MALARLGGLSVIGGWALLIVAGAIAVAGGSVGLGSGSIGSVVMAASLVLIGAGGAAVAVAGPSPLHGRLLRVGLGILGLGILGLAGSSIAAARLTYDAGEDGPSMVLLFAGGLATMVGAPVTVLSLLLTPGRPRVVGSAFVAGLLLLVLAGMANQYVGAFLAGAPAIAGGCLVIASGIGLGVLALRGERLGLAAGPA
jgi:hypothetical protein